jgi:hypothetical protein
MRLTLLDNCGRPVYSPCSYVVTKGHLTVTIEPELQEGEEVSQPNAAGEIIYAEKPDDQVKWHNIAMTMAQIDPELVVMLNPAWIKELDENGIAVGWRARRIIAANTGYAMEIWLGTPAANSCDDPNAQGRWAGFVVGFD